MKKNYLKLKMLFSMALVGLSLNSIAQDDISNLFKAGIADLNKLADGYMKPMGTGFAAGLGSNWYNTAAPHKLFGFDLTLSAGVAFTPASDKTFSLTGLQNLKPVDATITSAPSFAGKGKGVEMRLMQPQTINGVPNPNAGQEITRFSTPDGLTEMIPTVNLQLAIGLPFGTEIIGRYVPTVKLQGLSTGLWGIGVKHDFKQWIPVVSVLPFDASVLLGYTKYTLNYDFPASAIITPDDLVSAPVTYVPPVGNPDYTTQKFDMTASAFTANVIVSKKLLFFTPYLGFGFTSCKYDVNFKGTYPILGNPVTDITSPNVGKMQVNVVENPLTVSNSEFMPGATIGFRLKFLFIISLHAQYTMQKYPIASAGFGINFR